MDNRPDAQMHLKLEIGDFFQQTNLDSALFWYNSAIPKGIIDSVWIDSASDAEKYYLTVALARSGIILVQKGLNGDGISNLERSFLMASAINQPQLSLYASDNLAVIFARRKQPDKATEYFEKSLSIYQQLNDEKGIVFCLGNLGSLNANQRNYYKAADYYEQLLGIQGQSLSPQEILMI